MRPCVGVAGFHACALPQRHRVSLSPLPSERHLRPSKSCERSRCRTARRGARCLLLPMYILAEIDGPAVVVAKFLVWLALAARCSAEEPFAPESKGVRAGMQGSKETVVLSSTWNALFRRERESASPCGERADGHIFVRSHFTYPVSAASWAIT